MAKKKSPVALPDSASPPPPAEKPIEKVVAKDEPPRIVHAMRVNGQLHEIHGTHEEVAAAVAARSAPVSSTKPSLKGE